MRTSFWVLIYVVKLGLRVRHLADRTELIHDLSKNSSAILTCSIGITTVSSLMHLFMFVWPALALFLGDGFERALTNFKGSEVV